jgi:hypothetical protein
MVIATRVLTARTAQGDVDIPIRIFAPEKAEIDWSCRFDIGWPEEMLTRAAFGVDPVQSLFIAMQMIGAQIYASSYHEKGLLKWQGSERGYGFPVPNGIRDMLVGDDRTFL